MKAKLVALIFLGSVALMRADQTIERVQQALKDQGFYYGEITGEANATLTAAIRRYQIRNGLQVNGELNSETLHSLGIDSSAPARPAAKAVPSPTPGLPDLRDQSSGEAARVTPPAVQPFTNAPQNRQIYPSQSRDARYVTGRTPCRNPLRGCPARSATQCGCLCTNSAGPSRALSR